MPPVSRLRAHTHTDTRAHLSHLPPLSPSPLLPSPPRPSHHSHRYTHAYFLTPILRTLLHHLLFPGANAAFQRISDAYEVLGDPYKRVM